MRQPPPRPLRERDGERVLPILRPLVPLLIGMIGAVFFHDLIKWNNPLLVIVLLISFATSALTYFKSAQAQAYRTIFVISTSMVFAFTGAINCLHSIEKAQQKYGDRWQSSVYLDNAFDTETARNIQQRIHLWLLKKGMTGQEGAVFEAMTIGRKTDLTRDTKEAFAHSGVSHILALSGYHVSMVCIFLQVLLLSRIVGYRARRISHTLLLLCLWAYAFITGMSPSLVRAVIMSTLLIAAQLHSRQMLSLNALALSAFIILLLSPLSLLHVGFQMSYLSMIGIYFLGIPLGNIYHPFTLIDKYLWQTITITLSCTLFTLPIVCHTFGRMATLGIFANITVSLLTLLLFSLIPLWALTLFTPPICMAILHTSHLILQNVRYISSLPHSSLAISFTLPGMILYYSLLAAAIIVLRRIIIIR